MNDWLKTCDIYNYGNEKNNHNDLYIESEKNYFKKYDDCEKYDKHKELNTDELDMDELLETCKKNFPQWDTSYIMGKPKETEEEKTARIKKEKAAKATKKRIAKKEAKLKELKAKKKAKKKAEDIAKAEEKKRIKEAEDIAAQKILGKKRKERQKIIDNMPEEEKKLLIKLF